MIAHVRQIDRYGCAIACCAMVRGVSYAEVAATFGPPDRGFTHDVWQQYLALYGFAAQHLFSHDPMAGKSRSPWPLEPWAPLHLCSVDAGCGFGSHLVVLREDGVVLDPAADAPRRLTDYASINFMVGIFRVGAQPGARGHLVPASLPAGTGSADEGTVLSGYAEYTPVTIRSGTGAPASPAGLLPDGHAPTGHAGFAAAIPSREIEDQLLIVQSAVNTDLWITQRLADHDWRPNRMNIEAARNAIRDATKAAIAIAALAGEARKGQDAQRLDPKDDHAAPQGATPTPDPAGEAKALLERLDPRLTPEQHIRRLREGADDAIEPYVATAFYAHADRIEAALATLHASQDQAGEVRS